MFGLGKRLAVAVLFLRTLKLRLDALGSDLAFRELLYAMNRVLVLCILLFRVPSIFSLSFGMSMMGRSLLLDPPSFSSLTMCCSDSGVSVFNGLLIKF